MFKVTVQDEADNKFIPIMEYALNDTYKKMMGARLIYGNKVIDYLMETKQVELLMDAINGKLEESNIAMDEETYKRIFEV